MQKKNHNAVIIICIVTALVLICCFWSVVSAILLYAFYAPVSQIPIQPATNDTSAISDQQYHIHVFFCDYSEENLTWQFNISGVIKQHQQSAKGCFTEILSVVTVNNQVLNVAIYSPEKNSIKPLYVSTLSKFSQGNSRDIYFYLRYDPYIKTVEEIP